MTRTAKAASRLPAIAEPPADPLLAEILSGVVARGGRILNVHRASGHAPRIFKAYAGLAGALRHETGLGRPLSEVVILRIALRENSSYELGVHRRMARDAGLSDAKIEAIAEWQDSPLFDARERAALALTDRILADGEIDDDQFAALSRHFDARAFTELAALASYYVGNSRFVRALRVADED